MQVSLVLVALALFFLVVNFDKRTKQTEAQDSLGTCGYNFNEHGYESILHK